MKHPTKEQLITFSYGECDLKEQAEVQAHLNQCADCQTTLKDWSQVKTELSSWQISPLKASFQRYGAPFLKWGMAAVFFVSCGFGLNSMMAANRTEELTKKIAAQVQREAEARFEVLLTKEMQQTRDDLIEEFKIVRAADRHDFIQALQSIDQQRGSEYASLRKDLETVALNADAKLRRTQRELGHLAILASLNTPEDLNNSTETKPQ